MTDEGDGDFLGRKELDGGTTSPREEFVHGPVVRDRGGRDPHVVEREGRHDGAIASEGCRERLPEGVFAAVPENEIQGPARGIGSIPQGPQPEIVDMAEATKARTVTDGNFTESVEEQGGLVMVDFWAEWCGPCRIVGPIVNQLADEYSEQGVVVGKLDVDDNPRTASRFGIRSIPSILFFKDGKHVDTVVGAVPKAQLEKKILEHI